MAQPTPAIYTVQSGDSLFAIAQRFYDDGNQWHRIYDYSNKEVIGSDPNLIHPGQVLYIPSSAIYTVQSGDSLFAIAQRFYDDGNQWPRIYDYSNKQVIGNDPNYIVPGEVLYIPPIGLKTCTVTSSIGLRGRAAPNTQSTILHTFPQGTVLTFFEVVNGQNVEGNPRWGHSYQGYYFWLGGTDHPNG